MIPLQAEVVKDVLSIQYVSVVGLLLLACVVMAYVIRYMVKRCDDREKVHAEEIKDKDEKIMALAEKYYVLSTKTYTILKVEKDV